MKALLLPLSTECTKVPRIRALLQQLNSIVDTLYLITPREDKTEHTSYAPISDELSQYHTIEYYWDKPAADIETDERFDIEKQIDVKSSDELAKYKTLMDGFGLDDEEFTDVDYIPSNTLLKHMAKENLNILIDTDEKLDVVKPIKKALKSDSVLNLSLKSKLTLKLGGSLLRLDYIGLEDIK